MNPTGLAVALVLGLLIGAALTALVLRRRRSEPVAAPAAPEETDDVEIPAGLAAVLDVLNSAVVLVGRHDQVLRASHLARSFGLARGSRIGIGAVLDIVREARRDHQTRDVGLEVKQGTGLATVALSIRIAPLEDGLVLVLADDKTAALRIEETRRDFVANVSHELKTPVGALSLLSEAVGEAADDPEAVRKFAGRMEVESARLTELVGQIIDLSRLQGDEPLREADLVDVASVVTDAVDRCRVEAEQHQVHLTQAPVRGCEVLGSDRLLTVAVQNLVQNAIAYSDAGARVVVAAKLNTTGGPDGQDEVVEITVSDTGIGIAAKDIDRIFERFYRVDYGRSRASGGTGLGLSIVKHIAVAHGGQVSVWSHLGQGSTFTITLPAHLSRDDERAQHSPAGVGTRSGDPTPVLPPSRAAEDAAPAADRSAGRSVSGRQETFR